MEAATEPTPEQPSIRLADAHGPIGDPELAHLLAQLAGAGPDPVVRIEVLAKLQRWAGWALRDAVETAREQRQPWQEITSALRMAPATLHRQLDAGGRVVIPPSRHERRPT